MTGDVGWGCIPCYISNITTAVLTFTAALCLIMLMYNGYRYMLGPVTEGSNDAAKKGITYSLIGLVISLLAYIIIETVVQSVTP